jgi:hypothetical protein
MVIRNNTNHPQMSLLTTLTRNIHGKLRCFNLTLNGKFWCSKLFLQDKILTLKRHKNNTHLEHEKDT